MTFATTQSTSDMPKDNSHLSRRELLEQWRREKNTQRKQAAPIQHTVHSSTVPSVTTSSNLCKENKRPTPMGGNGRLLQHKRSIQSSSATSHMRLTTAASMTRKTSSVADTRRGISHFISSNSNNNNNSSNHNRIPHSNTLVKSTTNKVTNDTHNNDAHDMNDNPNRAIDQSNHHERQVLRSMENKSLTNAGIVSTDQSVHEGNSRVGQVNNNQSVSTSHLLSISHISHVDDQFYDSELDISVLYPAEQLKEIRERNRAIANERVHTNSMLSAVPSTVVSDQLVPTHSSLRSSNDANRSRVSDGLSSNNSNHLSNTTFALSTVRTSLGNPQTQSLLNDNQMNISFYMRRAMELESQLRTVESERDVWKLKYYELLETSESKRPN